MLCCIQKYCYKRKIIGTLCFILIFLAKIILLSLILLVTTVFSLLYLLVSSIGIIILDLLPGVFVDIGMIPSNNFGDVDDVDKLIFFENIDLLAASNITGWLIVHNGVGK